MSLGQRRRGEGAGGALAGRGEAEENIDSRGSTKHTAFPRSQPISILLYSICVKV